MDAISKCKTRMFAAIDELERESGQPVLGVQMIVLTANANQTNVEDPKAEVRTIAVSMLAAGSVRRLPWLPLHARR